MAAAGNALRALGFAAGNALRALGFAAAAATDDG